MKLVRRMKKWLRVHLVGVFFSVRVYDNYVKNIRPKLSFRNKLRYSLKQWIPIGKDSPFGRLVLIKGYSVHSQTPIIKFGKLSDMGKNFSKNGINYVWTHWQES